MGSLTGKTRGEDLYDQSNLISITTDGSPNVMGKNVGLLMRIHMCCAGAHKFSK